MRQDQPTSSTAYHVKVDPAGRVMVPAPVRARLKIRSGDMLVMRTTETGLELRTYAQDAQNYFAAFAKPGRLLSQELIEDRHREAQTE